MISWIWCRLTSCRVAENFSRSSTSWKMNQLSMKYFPFPPCIAMELICGKFVVMCDLVVWTLHLLFASYGIGFTKRDYSSFWYPSISFSFPWYCHIEANFGNGSERSLSVSTWSGMRFSLFVVLTNIWSWSLGVWRTSDQPFGQNCVFLPSIRVNCCICLAEYCFFSSSSCIGDYSRKDIPIHRSRSTVWSEKCTSLLSILP